MGTKVIASVVVLAIAATVFVVWLRQRQQTALAPHGQRWVDGCSYDVAFTDLRNPAKSYRGHVYSNVAKEPRGVRMEFEYADRRRISIWRQDGYHNWVLDPDAKTYWTPKVEARVMVSSGPGPMGVEGEKSFLGREQFNGRDVEKWLITKPDGAVQECWEDLRLHACVKSIQQGVSEFEMTNIREGEQDAKWFELPSGYKEVPRPEK
jgi:hypothetical protein